METFTHPPLPFDKAYPLSDLGLPLSTPPVVSIYDPTPVLGLDFGSKAGMRDDDHHYWAPAPTAPMPSQPAYNSFMYPAPPVSTQAQPQPQEVQTAWAPHHSTPMGTYEEHVPSIQVESEPYVATQPHAMSTHWMPSPPTTMPDMFVPASPSSEGTHSPSLPDVWTLPPVHPGWSTSAPFGQSIQSSPASGVQELFYAPPSSDAWNAASSFSPSAVNLFNAGNVEPMSSVPRSRSFSYPNASFGEQFVAADMSGVHRRNSEGHFGPRSSPYPVVHSARASPMASRGASPVGREVMHSPATAIDDTDLPVLAKAVVTTDPVSEASARRRTHEARFKCDICGKCLTTKTNLEGHRKSHLGVKDFRCGVCDKPFTRDWDRKRHERTHSKKAELACNVCGKTSTRKDAFDKHRCRVPAPQNKPSSPAMLPFPF